MFICIIFTWILSQIRRSFFIMVVIWVTRVFWIGVISTVKLPRLFVLKLFRPARFTYWVRRWARTAWGWRWTPIRWGRGRTTRFRRWAWRTTARMMFVFQFFWPGFWFFRAGLLQFLFSAFLVFFSWWMSFALYLNGYDVLDRRVNFFEGVWLFYFNLCLFVIMGLFLDYKIFGCTLFDLRVL